MSSTKLTTALIIKSSWTNSGPVMEVLVLANYNMEETKKRGIWLKGKMDKMICPVYYVGVDLTPHSSP